MEPNESAAAGPIPAPTFTNHAEALAAAESGIEDMIAGEAALRTRLYARRVNRESSGIVNLTAEQLAAYDVRQRDMLYRRLVEAHLSSVSLTLSIGGGR